MHVQRAYQFVIRIDYQYLADIMQFHYLHRFKPPAHPD